MKIKKFIVNPFQMNCYLYYDDITFDAILIDPGVYTPDDRNELISFVSKNNIKIKYIINTHGHLDHILGNRFAKNSFEAPLLIHKEDLFLLERSKEQGKRYGIDIEPSPQPDKFITEDLILEIGKNKIEFIHTPGHTPGSICIVNHDDKKIFCGDLIFKDSIGRTDLPGGDYDILMNSINNKLFVLCNNDYALYPGHLEDTTIGEEKRNNPYLR